MARGVGPVQPDVVIDLGGVHRRRKGSRPNVGGSPRRSQLLYEEVIDLVERLVVELRLEPGDLLPTQAEIAERAGVSLITVRRALDELERDGRVRRHQGVGTFLAHPKIVSQPTAVGGLSGTLRGDGDPERITTELLSLRTVLPGGSLGETLRVQADEPLWQVRRLRRLRGTPMIIETALIPARLAPDLGDRGDELLGSLYELLADRYGLRDDYEEQYLEVTAPDPTQRRLLRLPARSQVVRLRGISVDQRGVTFDCFEQIYPAAGFVFAMAGSTSRQLLAQPFTRDWDIREPPASEPGG